MYSGKKCPSKVVPHLLFLGMLSVATLNALPTVAATEQITQTQQQIQTNATELEQLTQQSWALIKAGDQTKALEILSHAEQLAQQTLKLIPSLSPDAAHHEKIFALRFRLSEIYNYQQIAYDMQANHYAEVEGENGKAIPLTEQGLLSARKSLNAIMETTASTTDINTLSTNSIELLNSTIRIRKDLLVFAIIHLANQLQERKQEAIALLEEAKRLLETTTSNGDLTAAQRINLLSQLGFAYKKQGDFQQAETLLNRAKALAEQTDPDGYEAIAEISIYLGSLYQSQSQFDKAEQHLQYSIDLYQQHNDTRAQGSLGMLSAVYFERGIRGEPDYFKKSISLELQSIKLAETALEQSTNTSTPSLIQQERNVRQMFRRTERTSLARTYALMGEYAEARRYAEQNLTDQDNNLPPGADGSKATSLDVLAYVARKENRFPESLELFSKQYALFAAYQGSNMEHAASLQSIANSHLATLREGLEKGQLQMADILPQAFHAMQLAHGTQRLQAFQQIALRLAADKPAIQTQLQTLWEQQAQLKNLEERYTKGLTTADTSNTETLQQSIEHTNTAIQKQEQALQASFPTYAKLTNPEPLTIAQAQALLQPDEALMVWVENTVDSKEVHRAVYSHLMVIRHDRPATYHALPIDQAKITSDVDALRKALTVEKGQAQPSPFSLTSAHELYQATFAVAEPDLAGVKHIIAVQGSGMHNFPLHALVKTAPTSTDTPSNADYAKADWLVRHYSFAYLPSVHALADLRQPSPTQLAAATQPFLGMGDPILLGTPQHQAERTLRTISKSPRGDEFSVYDTDELRKLIPLPDTNAELHNIARHLGADPDKSLYLQKKATETVLKCLNEQGILAHTRILSFATHAGFPSDERTEAGLVLTPPATGTPADDGYLTASEVATLKLDHTDWVILSACDTGTLAKTDNQEGLSSLSGAFFLAGAHSVLASLWPVESQAAGQLTPNVFDKLQQDPTLHRAEALQLAMLDAIKDGCGWRCRWGLPDKRALSHPIYWAPFVIYGEGGAIH